MKYFLLALVMAAGVVSAETAEIRSEANLQRLIEVNTCAKAAEMANVIYIAIERGVDREAIINASTIGISDPSLKHKIEQAGGATVWRVESDRRIRSHVTVEDRARIWQMSVFSSCADPVNFSAK